MPLTKEAIIEKLQAFFREHEEMITLYLFGSWAKKNTSHPKDIDVAILLSEAKSTKPPEFLEQWIYYREKLQKLFSQEVDLIILNTANPILKQQIFFHGIQIGLRNKAEYLQFRIKSYQQQFGMVHIQQQMYRNKKESSNRQADEKLNSNDGKEKQSMVDKILFLKKLNSLDYHISRARKFRNLSYEEFQSNEDAKDIVAHNLFVAIQLLIDLMTHIISDEQLGEIAFISDGAEIMHREKIISQEEKEKLIQIIGFRNIIAHQYADVSTEVLDRIMTQDIEDLKQIVHRMTDYRMGWKSGFSIWRASLFTFLFHSNSLLSMNRIHSQ